MKGFINLIKPTGMSSARAVSAVKRAFKVPCGHMGTLDPMAKGVLPVGISKTSRLFPFLLSKTKTYVAEFSFGYSTDTLDVTGVKTAETSLIPSLNEVKLAASCFTGEIMQIPPKISAKCVGGKRGYQLARRGVEFELEPKKVSVFSIDVKGEKQKGVFEFEIVCGGGTYVRSLCRDIAEKCGSLAVMSALDRTESGCFNYGNGVPFDEFVASSEPEKYILPADFAVNFEKLVLSETAAKKILNGLFEKGGYKDGTYRVYCESERDFWGVGEVKDGVLRITSYVRD